MEGLIGDLKLAPAKREEALALIRPVLGSARTPPTDAAAAELLDRMQTILDDEEFENFKAALDRRSRPVFAIRTVVGPTR